MEFLTINHYNADFSKNDRFINTSYFTLTLSNHCKLI